MPAPLQPHTRSPLLSEQTAVRTLESLYVFHGPQRPWTYWMILAGVTAALGGLVLPTAERVDLRTAVSGHIAGLLARDNERAQLWQPLVVIRSRDLKERLARNHALQTAPADLIGSLHLLTTEPVMVTVNPSGDTAKKDDIAGPLFATSLLHGGSVVKPFSPHGPQHQLI